MSADPVAREALRKALDQIAALQRGLAVLNADCATDRRSAVEFEVVEALNAGLAARDLLSESLEEPCPGPDKGERIEGWVTAERVIGNKRIFTLITHPTDGWGEEPRATLIIHDSDEGGEADQKAQEPIRRGRAEDVATGVGDEDDGSREAPNRSAAVMTSDTPAPDSGTEDIDEDDMCPNCVTPWKCNGPHIPAGELREEFVRLYRENERLREERERELREAFEAGQRRGHHEAGPLPHAPAWTEWYRERQGKP